MTSCEINGCGGRVVARKLCRKHYLRWWRSGTTDNPPRFVGGTVFDHLFHVGWTVTATGCWEWSGSLDTHGYGQFKHDKTSYLAHRVAYEISKGPIAQGLLVRHSCSTRKCVNPDHLSQGTGSDNMRDMIMSDTYTRAKLSRSVAHNVRRAVASGRTQQDVANEFNIGQTTVSKIVRGVGFYGTE